MSRHSKITVFLLVCLILSACLFMLIQPARSLDAALRGIEIWWDVLFPALFPFLVMAEIFLGLGIVHFAGTLLDPLMRPVFRVTGKGGFVMAMGLASGYPVGARLASRLREQNLISRDEGERLVAFTSTSDPIFLIGAVSVGFFHNPGLAAILALAHYGGSVCVGVLMRFHGEDVPETSPEETGTTANGPRRSLVMRAFDAMHKARTEDARTPGQLLEDSVLSAIRLVFVIGGLVVFFSVIIEFLETSGLFSLLTAATASFLSLFGLPPELAPAVSSGLFEVTLGAKAAAQAGSGIPDMYKAAVAAFILSWAGLSVHAQIVSLLGGTGLRYAPFLAARAFHAAAAFCLVILFWDSLRPAMSRPDDAWPVWAAVADTVAAAHVVPWEAPIYGLACAALFAVFLTLVTAAALAAVS